MNKELAIKIVVELLNKSKLSDSEVFAGKSALQYLESLVEKPAEPSAT